MTRRYVSDSPLGDPPQPADAALDALDAYDDSDAVDEDELRAEALDEEIHGDYCVN